MHLSEKCKVSFRNGVRVVFRPPGSHAIHIVAHRLRTPVEEIAFTAIRRQQDEECRINLSRDSFIFDEKHSEKTTVSRHQQSGSDCGVSWSA